MNNMTYGFSRTFEHAAFDDVVGKVKTSLKTEGFGVLTEIDVGGTLKEKLDDDFRPYVILGACNPELARDALELEPHISLLLPCNVVVQQRQGGITVSIADPSAMFALVNNPGLFPVVEAAGERLERVMARLGRFPE